MSGERMIFRRRLFGGFDRQDVMDCVRRLAAERNTYRAGEERGESERERLGAQVEALENTRARLDGELTSLRREMAGLESRAREYGGMVADGARRGLFEIEAAYGCARDGAARAETRIRAELDTLSGTLEDLSRTIAAAGRRLDELRRDVTAPLPEPPPEV